MSCRWGISVYEHPEACVWGEGLWLNSGYKITISLLTWGSCECESKNSLAFRWGGVPTDQTRADYRDVHQIKARWGLFFFSQSGHVSALIHISIFPQPLCWHVNLERLCRPGALFGNTSLFLNNLRNSRVEIHTLAKQPLAEGGGFCTGWSQGTHSIFFQINTAGETMFKNKKNLPRQIKTAAMGAGLLAGDVCWW